MGNIMVTQSFMPPIEEYIEEIQSIWDSHWLTNMGEKHQLFESELKKYLGVDMVRLFTNGHSALELTLQAFDFPRNAEVITTPFTFASTTQAIVRNGLKPVFCDICEDNFTIDASKIENLITENTVAIVPVHVYGYICDIDKIAEIAEKYSLKVIYDAAHAFGIKVNGTGVGNFGDASMLSFHATKVFHSIEGGAVCTKDKELANKVNKLKNFGLCSEEIIDSIGGNAKMNEFCAAMGLCNLRYIDDQIDGRRKIVQHYRMRLSDVQGIRLGKIQDGVVSNYAYFPIRFIPDEFGADRNAVAEKLKENGIIARKYFYPLTSSFDCYNGAFNPCDTPVALQVSREILTLPLYANLDLKDVDRICDIIIGMQKEK